MFSSFRRDFLAVEGLDVFTGEKQDENSFKSNEC